MMDILSMLSDLLPFGIVVAILGITWAVRRYTLDENEKSPRWLILIPLGLGLLLGPIHYFAVTPTEELLKLTIGKRALTAIELAFAYGGGAVMLWELRSRYLKWKDERISKP